MPPAPMVVPRRAPLARRIRHRRRVATNPAAIAGDDGVDLTDHSWACQTVRTSPAGSPAASSPAAGVVVGDEAFVGDGHQLADPVERIGLASPVPDGLVLHPSAGLVEHEVGELHDMKRVRDLTACGSNVSNTDRYGPDDPTSPNGSTRTTRRAVRRTMHRCWQRLDQAQRPRVGLGPRRRPGSTTPDAGTVRAGRTAPHRPDRRHVADAVAVVDEWVP